MWGFLSGILAQVPTCFACWKALLLMAGAGLRKHDKPGVQGPRNDILKASLEACKLISRSGLYSIAIAFQIIMAKSGTGSWATTWLSA